MIKEPLNPQNRVSDNASHEVLAKALTDCVDTCFTRFEQQGKQCKFGTEGVCCKICHMGPCKITPRSPLGVCGADADTIVARNFLREVVGGAAAHSDHARHLVFRLKAIGEGKGGDYKIRDVKALKRIAGKYEIPVGGRTDQEIALDLANLFLGEFTSQQ